MPGVLQPRLDREEDEKSLSEDQAIALALEMCPPGESITIHARTCALTVDNPFHCTCTPMTLKKEAVA